jgi:N-acetyl-beta-hexosaminidase
MAAPSFTPAAGTYSGAQEVTISDAVGGATIYYTTDGTTPTTSSAVYSAPISVSADETLKAIAAVSGYANSPVVSATYKILTAAPSFTPAAGTYSTAQEVTISDAVGGATIYYTTNGSVPTTSSAVYSTPIGVSANEVLKAFAAISGSANSPVVSATYEIRAAIPTFTPAGGTYTGAQEVTISDAIGGATIYYTTDGSAPTTSSAVYSAPISVGVNESLKAIAVASGYSTSLVGTAVYKIRP